MKFVPTWFHGILDYVAGIALILAPNIFMFSGMGGPAVVIPRTLGVGLIIYSLLTNYEWSVAKIIPMPVHLLFDFIAAVVLAASPWIFGFSTGPMNAWMPHLVSGIIVIALVAVSKTHPDPMRMMRSI
ncbi:MAG TPA: SPW repeat protein [Candidatus Paceibacterota bacterium]|nr:SPW repeat protein [Candidatus Paceibacterota bacterium]